MISPLNQKLYRLFLKGNHKNISQCYIITYFQKESQEALCDTEMALIYSIKKKYVSKKGHTDVIPY